MGLSGLLSRCNRDDGAGLNINCTIDIAANPHSRKLVTGYNYYLVHEMARRRGGSASVRLSGREDSSLDSLKAGLTDLVIIPVTDSAAVDSTLACVNVDSAGLWVLRADDRSRIAQVVKWDKEVRRSDDHAVVRQKFFDVYNPFKRVSADFISPYDSLVKVYADTLGWDWKLLSAIIYQESRYKIEASSHRGAKGLMQMMPKTAARYGCHDLTDPEQSIRAGSLYLKKLSERYRSIQDPMERAKFVIAAYNAGEGRIKDCRNYARFRGTDPDDWEDITEIIPEMRDESILQVDTVKLGTFKGYETVSYVQLVLEIYSRYKSICP